MRALRRRLERGEPAAERLDRVVLPAAVGLGRVELLGPVGKLGECLRGQRIHLRLATGELDQRPEEPHPQWSHEPAEEAAALEVDVRDVVSVVEREELVRRPVALGDRFPLHLSRRVDPASDMRPDPPRGKLAGIRVRCHRWIMAAAAP